MKILFLQEHIFLATALRHLLPSKGYKLIYSNFELSSQTFIQNINPQMVIVDISYPTGFDFLREAGRNQIPTIVINVSGREQELQLAIDTGAADYVCLPVSPGELALRINILARHKINAIAS